jgi:hypothetical protein
VSVQRNAARSMTVGAPPAIVVFAGAGLTIANSVLNRQLP